LLFSHICRSFDRSAQSCSIHTTANGTDLMSGATTNNSGAAPTDAQGIFPTKSGIVLRSCATSGNIGVAPNDP